MGARITNRLVAIAAVSIALVQSATAGDLRWNGLYAGVNVTYAGGHDTGDTVVSRCCAGAVGSNSVTSGPDHFQLSPDGWFAGGQIGVNWQPRPNWLLGIELDYQGGHSSGARTNQTFGNLFLYIDSTQQRLAGLGTLRARVGYIHGPVLYYVTGGAASARVTTITTDFMHAAFSVGPVDVWSASGAIQERRYGFTIGGGVETKLSDHWSFKLEYLLVDLGRQEFSFVNRLNPASANSVTVHTDISEHLLRLGVNYRFAAF